MAHALNKLTIKGYKSIQSLEDFELTNLNVLIGGNGAGKSNFIDFFRMLRAMMGKNIPGLSFASLEGFINYGGKINNFLYKGSKITNQIETALYFDNIGYRFQLVPTKNENCLIHNESWFNNEWKILGSGHTEPKILNERSNVGKRNDSHSHNLISQSICLNEIYKLISSIRIYHFNDTSDFAGMRRSSSDIDNEYLRFDGENIAPMLLQLQINNNELYQNIISTIQLVLPFFDTFVFEPDKHESVKLIWKQKGSDMKLQPFHLSDGTIRFICLTTALMQPDPPSTIIIDEPELGLHPLAIDIIGGLINEASFQTQIIISTQSPSLLNHFEPDQVIVVDRDDGASTFKRLHEKDLSSWLEKYTLSELWNKNVISGGPIYE